MRLLCFSHHSNLDGGASKALLEQVISFQACGHAVVVVNRSAGPLATALIAADITSVVIPFEWSMSPRRRIRGVVRRTAKNLLAVPRLSRLIREWKPTHIYTNTTVIWIGALLARKYDLPHLWHLHEFADLDFGLHPDWGHRALHSLLLRSTYLVFNSKALQAHYPAVANHSSASVVYNGLFTDHEVDAIRRQAAESARVKDRFVIVGAIRPAKGQLLAIRALAICRQTNPQISLVIAGSGDPADLDSCRTLAADLGVSNAVHFTGFVPDPSSLYLTATASLMCSSHEAFGRVTVEAMARGCPVIGNNSGATPELIRHNWNGLLFNGEPQGLAEAMLYVCAHPSETAVMASRAQELALTSFRRAAITKQLLSILESN